MGYKIEKGIPIPEEAKRGRKRKYPFYDMEIGDSFTFAENELNRIHSAAHYYGKRNEKRFSTKKIKDGQYRCWRVE